MLIDCDECAVRGPGCRDCVVSVLLGVPETLLRDERAALEVLADVGLAGLDVDEHGATVADNARIKARAIKAALDPLINAKVDQFNEQLKAKGVTVNADLQYSGKGIQSTGLPANHDRYQMWLTRFPELRAGANQGYATFGLGLDVPFLKLDYAFYSDELGRTAGSIKQSSHMISLAIRFGSGKTEGRERIKQSKEGASAPPPPAPAAPAMQEQAAPQAPNQPDAKPVPVEESPAKP